MKNHIKNSGKTLTQIWKNTQKVNERHSKTCWKCWSKQFFILHWHFPWKCFPKGSLRVPRDSSWAPLGASWAALARLLGSSWRLLGASWSLLVLQSLQKSSKRPPKGLPKPPQRPLKAAQSTPKPLKRSPKAPQLSSCYPLATFLWCFPVLQLLRCARMTLSAEKWNSRAPSSKLEAWSWQPNSEAES